MLQLIKITGFPFCPLKLKINLRSNNGAFVLSARTLLGSQLHLVKNQCTIKSSDSDWDFWVWNLKALSEENINKANDLLNYTKKKEWNLKAWIG